MLALENTHVSKRRKLTPNILPCSIRHSGPVDVQKRHWSPSTPNPSGETPSTVYFRGRKLRGRTAKLPEGYTGLVLQKTDKVVQQKPARKAYANHTIDGDAIEHALGDVEHDGEDDNEEKDEEVKAMEERGRFDEVVVWGHEVMPEKDDEYVKGVQEWIAFAEAMHTNPYPANKKELPSAPMEDKQAKLEHIEHVNDV